MVAGCAGRNILSEEGARQCSDSLDNDSDGHIDCADPGCHAVAFCSSRLDGSATDASSPADASPAPDQQIPTDGSAPASDLQDTDSSYGNRCPFSGTVTLCPDGDTVCVLSKYSDTWGYCTHACDTQGGYCPPGPDGTYPYCGYVLTPPGAWFCVFLCDQYPCPGDLSCTAGFCFSD